MTSLYERSQVMHQIWNEKFVFVFHNKLEYQSEGAHTCRERVPTKVALFHTCMSGHCIREESLLVLKLITVRGGISPPNDITGVSL